jgi:hypothetical protein
MDVMTSSGYQNDITISLPYQRLGVFREAHLEKAFQHISQLRILLAFTSGRTLARASA